MLAMLMTWWKPIPGYESSYEISDRGRDIAWIEPSHPTNSHFTFNEPWIAWITNTRLPTIAFVNTGAVQCSVALGLPTVASAATVGFYVALLHILRTWDVKKALGLNKPEAA